jgi:hypothetical protein
MNLVAAKPQSDPIGKLLELVRVDFNGFAAEPEETPYLDANRLNLTIGRSLHIDDLTDVPVVGAQDAHASQIGQLPGRRLHCRDDALASSRQRFALLHHALSNTFGLAALGLDVGPTGIGNPLDAVNGVAELARCPIQGELAPERELVVMRLHAQEHPALAACDRAAELLDVVAAAVFNRFCCRGKAIPDCGLRGHLRRPGRGAECGRDED